jgi:hypothetical protein
MRFSVARLAVVLGIAALAALCGPSRSVDAATIAVTTGCRLDEAIVNANNDDQSGSTSCAAGSGADTIVFTSAAARLGTA